jgi:PadR family transcriptional regulator, regulatory protein PadR
MSTKPVRDLELSVLLSVSHLDEDAYSLRIREQVSTQRRHDYSVGAIHTALQRLEEKQLVESWMTAPLPVRGGRSRRQYRLTTLGKGALREAQQSAERLWADVDLRGKPA